MINVVDLEHMALNGYSIVSTQPVPSGWQACYLGSVSREEQEAEILKLPIALWVVVAVTDDNGECRHEIRHFVATPNGELIDYLDVEFPFLCIAEPGINMEHRAKAALQEHLRETDEKADSEALLD